MTFNKKKILGVCSSGGHSVQLKLILSPLLENTDIYIFTSSESVFRDKRLTVDETLLELNRQDIKLLPKSLYQSFSKLREIKPDLVVSTGALPGLNCILCARLLGLKTLWIDSIANTKHLSLSGKIAKHIAHKTLSQWPEIAQKEKVQYEGSLL